MTGIKNLFVIAMFCRFLPMMGQEPGELANALSSLSPYQATAMYEVWLPSAADPVRYTIELLSYTPAEADSLAPCDYLIRWKLFAPGQNPATDSPRSEGFSAYFDGSHYRYRTGEMMQEYHYQWDATPFHPRNIAGTDTPDVGSGVQNCAQFTELLPQYIARQLRIMDSDPAYTNSTRSKGNKLTVKGVERSGGYDRMEYEYTFTQDAKQGSILPLGRETTTSPGAISEQSVSVKYTYPKKYDSTPVPLSEARLMELYPTEFSTMRQSNFRVESLREAPMPSYSAQDQTGARRSYSRGEGFANPTIFVFLDSEVGDNQSVMEAVRSGVGTLPFGTDIMWVLTSAKNDGTDPVAQPGETVLTTARSLARDCGVTAYPTLLFCNRQGIIKDVQIGVNKDMVTDVIQKTMLCN